MISISYTATRRIPAAGAGGTLLAAVESFDYVPKSYGVTHVSLNRTYVNTFHAREESYRVTVEPQDTDEIEYFREFEASCCNGETFTVDASGIPGAPDVIMTCILKNNSYKEKRNGSYISPTFELIRIS